MHVYWQEVHTAEESTVIFHLQQLQQSQQIQSQFQ
jgi:hypothetical protein